MGTLIPIQLSTNQLEAVTTIVKRKAPCKVLVFGMGNDSIFWSKCNRGGVTIFLEDNEEWYQRVTQGTKGLTAFVVDYNTKRTDWKMLLNSPSLLRMTLPRDVEKVEWDVILVDGPKGWNDQTPGRMKSIFLSSTLAAIGGDIFIDDCEREIEDAYCNAFLKKQALKMEIRGRRGNLLRHYHIEKRCT